VVLDQQPLKILDRRGVNRAYLLTNGFDKERITVALATTASGEFLKAMIIFHGTSSGKGKIDKSFQAKPEYKDKFIFRQNDTAWMTTSLFEEYLDLLFPNNQKHRLVIFDTAACHGYKTAQHCLDPELLVALFTKK
jgi:hypothetical protein